MKCNQCGTENSEGAVFCVGCGAKLEAPVVSQPEPAPQPIPAPQPQPAPQPMPQYSQQNNYNGGPNGYNNAGPNGYYSAPNPANTVTTKDGQVIPKEYKPISMWGYFGYNLLFAIPLVGFILLIVFAVSSSNVNLKNYARSFFCSLIIALILFVIIFVFVMITGGLAAMM